MPQSLPLIRNPPNSPRLVRYDWLCRVAAESGKCLHLGVTLSWLASIGKVPGVRLGRRVLAKYSISRDACYDALRRLEAAKLVRVWRLPGRSPHVILLEVDGTPLRVA